MDTYAVKLSNCNSIEAAEIEIKKGYLNIKYGSNGIGKSTISKAIVGKTKNDGSLENLIPFKLRTIDNPPKPEVTGIEDITSVLVFDEDYVNQFTFQKDEVVKDSFDIFIKNEDYKNAMEKIEILFSGIKNAFEKNEDISKTIADLKELREAFGNSKTSTIPKNSKIHKAYGDGNKFENIPQILLPFEKFIKSTEPSKWIAWQTKGNDFLEISENCPYCSTNINTQEKKETILSVSKEYDAKSAEHLNQLKAVIERLGKYFSEECKNGLDKVTKSKIELAAEEKVFLSNLKNEIETFIEKLEGLRLISFFSLRDVEKIDEKIIMLKIDLSLINKLDSDASKNIAETINNQLEELLKKIGQLKGNINKHKSAIEKTIVKNQENINSFLKSAGYKYNVVIIPETDSYKMKLIHLDSNKHIETASRHLSYGEKNAFALVLFMHQVLSKNPDLAILDDPISSFDKNKKFAILHELFRGKFSLRGKTVLMLTHDIEPAIDIIKNVSTLFEAAKPFATFLFSKNGIVKETPIKKEDIQTFARICKQNISLIEDKIIKSIYLRRHYEIINDKGNEYNILSNSLHRREKPVITENEEEIEMPNENFLKGESNIKNDISDFSYIEILKEINNLENMKKRFYNTLIGYEKIQLFRILRGKHEDDIIAKFINESYHIENEYVMQLNPHKFDSVPEYVIQECSKIIETV